MTLNNFGPRSPDTHTRSQEEITLQDQIPTGRDPYVIITFDEVYHFSLKSHLNLYGFCLYDLFNKCIGISLFTSRRIAVQDIMMDALPPEQDFDSGVQPMDKKYVPNFIFRCC